MDLLFSPERRSKYIILALFLLIIVLFLGFLRLITGSFLLAVLLLLALLYLLLRLVGVYVMYPGSSNWSKADIEIRMSREISQRMVTFFNATHFLSVCVAQNKYLSHQNPFDLVAVVLNHVKQMQEVLSMFEPTLSERKTRMLTNYRTISQLLEEKTEEEPSISELIHKPRAIDALPPESCQQFKDRFVKIEERMLELHSFIKSFSPPEGLFAQIKFKLFEQNLYELRFAFHTWNSALNYQLFTVSSSDDAQLETTIIHNELKKSFFMKGPSNKPNTSLQTVLFCNPNGVYIQFFGYDNEYIRNYLRMGYNVILWNYRGYGQSTGSPSILKSQIDAAHVYNFYQNQGYDIKIVHGYSIGGAAAVGIFQKIGEEQAKNIEVLIIDRSFSSIGEMSIEFGPMLHRLTKLLFCGDNIDLSQQFQSVRCRKLLIWDNLDEVIPDRASFKNRIIKRRRKKPSKSNLEENQLNEDENSNPDFQHLTNKLNYTMRALLALISSNPGNSEDRELKSVALREREQASQTHQECSTTDKNNNEALEQLVKIINAVDGGGIELFLAPHELQKCLESNPDKFYHICESYILGLVCYGSYFPLQPYLHDHQKIKEQTLLKLERSMQDIRERFSINGEEPSLLFKKEGGLEQLARNVYHIYFKLSQMVTDYFSEEWFSQHGSLLPTNNGHNCQLTEAELRILNAFIANVIPPPLQEPNQEGDEQIELRIPKSDEENELREPQSEEVMV